MKLFQSILLKRWVIVLTGLLLILLSACSDDSDLEKRQDELEQSVTDLQSTNTALQATVETLANAQGAPVPGPFPTAIDQRIIVAEQVFEGGRMFWIRETRTIWVAVGEIPDPTRGDWLCFEDTFEEGDLESDPELDPPEDTTTESQWTEGAVEVRQPIRGFGKIWRENEDLRKRLGWALVAEVENLDAHLIYIAGGYLDDNKTYVAEPGEWRLNSYFGETFIFSETEIGNACPNGVWRLEVD